MHDTEVMEAAVRRLEEMTKRWCRDVRTPEVVLTLDKPQRVRFPFEEANKGLLEMVDGLLKFAAIDLHKDGVQDAMWELAGALFKRTLEEDVNIGMHLLAVRAATGAELIRKYKLGQKEHRDELVRRGLLTVKKKERSR